MLEGASRRTVTVVGHELSLLEIGAGPAAVVWFPALMDSAVGFARVARRLAASLRGRARVVAVDPPGYGVMERPGARTPSFEDLGGAAQALGRQLKGPILAVGNSSGAVLATALAAGSDAVVGLALVGWCDWRRVGSPHTELLCPSTEAELDHLEALSWHSPRPRPAFSIESHLERARSEDYRAHVMSFDPQRYGAWIDDFKGHLTLIGGKSDRVIRPEMIERTAAAREGSRLLWLPACGHYPHKEQPVQLADMLYECALDAIGTESSAFVA